MAFRGKVADLQPIPMRPVFVKKVAKDRARQPKTLFFPHCVEANMLTSECIECTPAWEP